MCATIALKKIAELTQGYHYSLVNENPECTLGVQMMVDRHFVSPAHFPAYRENALSISNVSSSPKLGLQDIAFL